MIPAPRLWGIAVLGCVSIIPILIGPIITGVLVDFGGLSDSEAGMTSAYGAVGSVAVALICALTMHRLPLRKLAIAGLSLAVVGNLGAAFFYSELGLFYALRALNALGDGAVYAAVMSSFAREKNSERCYGLFMMLQFGLAGAGLWALPTLWPEMGVTTMYIGFASLQLIAAPLLVLPPSRAADVAGISIRGSEWRLLLSIAALAGLVALCFSEASNIATDVYLERIAVLAGLSDDQIGATLGIASVVGVPGAFAILLLGARFGHAIPVLAGIGVGAVSLFGIMEATSHSAFFWFVCIHSFTWAFTTPYIQALLADMDPGGAVVTAGGIASGAGAGLGPAAAATMVTATDYSGVYLVSFAAYAVAAAAIVVSAMAMRRSRVA